MARKFRRADHGQMMMLSAIVLVIAFVALAAMVARVNQLGTQTGTESRRLILDEAKPLVDSLSTAVYELGGARSSGATVTTTLNGLTITSTVDLFTPQDVGRHIAGTNMAPQATIASVTSARAATLSIAATGTTTTGTVTFSQFTATTVGAPTTPCTAPALAVGCSVITASASFFQAPVLTDITTTTAKSPDIGRAVTGTGIPAGARIVKVTSATQATISCPTACSGIATPTALSIGKFALSSTTSPTLDNAVAGVVEQVQAVETRHGLLLDWSCKGSAAGGDGILKVRLNDGTVWLDLRPAPLYRCDAAANLSG